MSTSPWMGFQPVARAVKSTEKDVKRRREDAEEKRYDVECWVIDYLRNNDLQPWLEGTAGLVIPDETVRGVEAAICEEFAGDPRRWAINFLVRGLERGRKELGWQVRPPGRIVKLKLPSPALNPERFRELSEADTLRTAFVQRWRTHGPERPTVQAGDVLFAAIAYSAIIHPPRLIGFCQHAHTHLNRFEETSWVEWPSAANRWDRALLDPVTEALLLRWRIERGVTPLLDGAIVATTIWQAINAVLQLRRQNIRSLRALLAPFQSFWAFELPHVIHRWAVGQQASAVLPPAAFFRVLSRQRLRAPGVETSEAAENSDAGRDPMQDAPAPPSVDRRAPGQAWIQTLRAVVPRRQKPAPALSKVSQALKDFIASVPAGSLPALLAQWILHDIQPKRSGGRKLRISSAFTLLSRIDRRLQLFLADASPLSLIENWDDILLEVAGSVRPSNRGPVVNALRAFHRYLQDTHGFPPLDVDLGDGAESSVDANLITEDEFLLVRKMLDRHDRSHPDAPTQIAAILARRSCLRRSETHGLRIRDIIGHDRLTLLVMPHRKRTLKRGASRRAIDLSAFCTEDEFALIRGFVGRKRAGTTGPGDPLQDSPLFEDPDNPGWPVSERRLFHPIEAAMRAVTGDASLRFHHLRHSGINLYGLKIFEDIFPEVPRMLEMPGSTPSHTPAPALLDALVGPTHPMRPRLWSVAAVAGHATPETTLESYFHLCDWVLYRFALRTIPPLEDALTAGLAGMSVSHLRVLRHRHGPKRTQLSALLWARLPPKQVPLPTLAQFEPLRGPDWTPFETTDDAPPAEQARPTPCLLLDALRRNKPDSALVAPQDADNYRTRILHAAQAPKRFSEEARSIVTIGRVRIERSWPLPGLPPATAERIQGDSLGLALTRLGVRYPRLLAKWVSLYAQYRYPRAHAMRLLQPAQAAWWLRVLLRATRGANTNLRTDDEHFLQIMAEHSPAKRSRQGPSAQRAHWQAVVPDEILWTTIQDGEASPSTGTPPYGTLYVWIRPPRSADAGSRQDWGRRGGSALELAAYYALLTLD